MTETKSGRVIRTPGKFSACITGKHKMHKNRKNNTTLDSLLPNDTMNNFAASVVTNSSLAVNTSQQSDDDEEVIDGETTFSCLDDTSDQTIESTLPTVNFDVNR